MHAHKSSEFKSPSLKEELYLVISITKDMDWKGGENELFQVHKKPGTNHLG